MFLINYVNIIFEIVVYLIIIWNCLKIVNDIVMVIIVNILKKCCNFIRISINLYLLCVIMFRVNSNGIFKVGYGFI